jgi:hypothetical protein
MGTARTNFIAGGGTVTEVAADTYGTSAASLVQTTTSGKRFTTNTLTVVAGETYDFNIWVNSASGDLAMRLYDETNGAYISSVDYVDLATESNGSLTMITKALTIPAGCTSAEFIIYIASSPASGVILDSMSIVAGGTPPPPPALKTIYDIQYTANADGISPEADNLVTTKGVVTGVFQIGSSEDRFFIQDGDGAWNGIYVYENGTTVNVGDSVEVSGKVVEYFELTEITNVTNITILNSGNAQPTPVVVTSATVGNEEYEGVLVKVEDAVNTVAPDQYGVWTINDGGNVLIDDDLMSSFSPVFGNGYDVTGVRHLSFGDVLVLPRNAVSDIVTVGYASINENELELSVYPNPANENVTISGIENGNVTIFAVNGTVVYNGVANGTTTINVNDFTPGFYTVEVVENGLKANYKLMVK